MVVILVFSESEGEGDGDGDYKNGSVTFMKRLLQ